MDCLKKVVIVDTGITIDTELKSFQKCIDGYHIFVKNDQYEIISFSENSLCIADDVGHGTGVAEIIASHNDIVELTIIKAFDEKTMFIDENLLIFIFDFILKNIDFDIVNLSLGMCSVSNYDRFLTICNKFYEAGKIIVAAYDNTGSMSFPALFPSVIGVNSETYCVNSNKYYFVKNSSVNICAKGTKQIVYWKSKKRIFASGNSYACAHFSGILSCFDKKGTREEIIQDIYNNCEGVIECEDKSFNPPSCHFISNISKVAVFPFNKEIHNIVRFSDKLNFEIAKVYDIKYAAKIGISTNSILKEKSAKNFIIEDIEKIDLDSFDTFILGHTDTLSMVLKSKFNKCALIEKIVRAKKYIYSFDEIDKSLMPPDYDLSKYYFTPCNNSKYRYVAPFGKLYRQDKPVVGVFGTSSKQGKFTLQLKMRYTLLDKGYNLCQIGTEPSALLFGMEGIFHNGYNSGHILCQYDAVAYLNRYIYNLSRDADIILVGGQSGVVLRDEGNLSNYFFKQIDFLLATLPDVIILCINSFDDPQIIQRTVSFLEGLIGCKVIALVLFPFYFEDNDTYHQNEKFMPIHMFENEYRQKFEKTIGLPVFYPQDDSIKQLCDLTLSYFRCIE